MPRSQRVTSPAAADVSRRRDYVNPDDFAHPSSGVEDAIHDEWRAHLAPLEAVAGVEAAAREYNQAGHRLDKTVAAAKAAGASWTDIGRAVGISTLMVDHPGTGEALRLRKQTAVVESETWGAACVDYLESRQYVDKERIGIVGWSLGGYYAPRAAAYEKRFKLCACWGANYNWGELQRRRAEREGENPVPHYWEHVQWVWGKNSFEEFMEFAPAVTLESVVPDITVPFLVSQGSGDRQIPLEYAHAQYYGAVKSPDRELRILTEREGGVEHVGGDNMLPASSIIADWVAARL